LTDHHDDSFIIRAWHEIATSALRSRASDIHIEAGTQETLIRIRVDGLLQIHSRLPIALHERLITRIKILSRLDIAEKRVPQDGRLCIGHDFSSPDIDCRVSVLPTLHGEKAVVRILLSQAKELTLDQTGLLPEQLVIFQDAIKQTNGLLLVTGPTGSGKTRTLYSCLNELNQTHRNLCSIEDPIEIRLPGVNQVAYHPRAGLDFTLIIKALLRQDPDVIMIGEIRDSETAKLAIQAAQTGHLVLSTLHTRNARAATSRLQSLGVDQEAIRSCLRSVSSQRLIRKICSTCQSSPSTPKKNACNTCNGNGFYGRIGVHEVLSMQHLMDPSLPALNLYEAGLRHVKQGLIHQQWLDDEVGTWH
jgi:type II secretory ATPase GspE/PulE/Tfp pilus assembly ATPase PilB-like protein